MKRVMSGWMLGIAAVVAVGVGARVVEAADPVVVGPHIYKVVFENERVRVSEATFAPGAKIPMHEHPDHFVYVITPGKLKLSYPDGRAVEFNAVPGKVTWIPAEMHAGENIGTTEVKLLVTELKPLPAYKP